MTFGAAIIDHYNFIFNIIAFLGFWRKIGYYDDELRGWSRTFERQKYTDRSTIYYKMIKVLAILHLISLFGELIVVIFDIRWSTVWYLFPWTYIAILYAIVDIPYLVIYMAITSHREKTWMILSSNKHKLTKKERRELEEDVFGPKRRRNEKKK